MNVVKVVVKESAIRSRAGEMCFMFGYGKVFTQNLVAFILGNYDVVVVYSKYCECCRDCD